VLSEDNPSSLNVTGNAKVVVQGGDIQVNSSSSKALTASGNGTLTANNINIVGGYKFTGNGGTTSPIHTGVGAMSDPYSNLDAPSVSNNLGGVSLSGNQTKTISPGYYPNGISVSGNGQLTMSPGIYNIGGSGLSVTGNATMTANGVMLYLSGSAGINLTGNGAVVLTPPTTATSSTYAGISVFQNENNEASDTISGNSNLQLDGVIYLPSATVTLSGNGGTFGAQIVADQVTVSGNGTVNINFLGTKPPLTSNPALVQ